jgi:beta-glucosidase
LRARFANVRDARGCDLLGDDTSGIAEAVALARASDVAVCCVGGRSGLLRDCTSGEFIDATSLDLPGVQRALVEAIVDTGRPTVVVVVSGRVHALPWLVGRAAIVYAWCPGEQGGAAIADILSGDVPPSGRLPVTVPRNVGQIPTHHDHRAGGGMSQMLGDYADSPASPLYAFGHGLSYTTFTYDDLDIADVTTSEPFLVTCTVTNDGARAGVEVVQCYVRDEIARCARPDRQLVGFARVALDPGARCTVRLMVDPTLFAYYDEAMRLVVEPGAVRVMIGASAGDIRLARTVEMTGAERLISPNDRRPTAVTLDA